jgi:ABC-2 type transport system permease protein
MQFYTKKQWNLLREFALFQFKVKDQSTVLGYLWSFLNPIIMLAILFIMFNARMGENVEHYGAYLLIGIVQYTYFSNATIASMQALHSMRQLTKEAVFPKELLVIGTVLSKTVEFVISYFIAVVFVYASGVNFSWTALLFPAVIVLQVMLVFWVSLLLSCFYLYFKDFEHIYQVFLRVLFFITPIFYELSYLGHGAAKSLVFLNPLTCLIMFSREIIIKGELFSATLFFAFAVINLLMIQLAVKIFRKLEPTFAELV